jgi:hypothetical protein
MPACLREALWRSKAGMPYFGMQAWAVPIAIGIIPLGVVHLNGHFMHEGKIMEINFFSSRRGIIPKFDRSETNEYSLH